MRINLEILPTKRLLHIFDLASKAHNKFLAAQVVNELTKKNHLTIDDQLRKLGKLANRDDNIDSFQMVTRLWEDK